jgi:hypothetical protein
VRAAITYSVENLPHPFDEKQRAQGIHAWCIVKNVQPAMGIATAEPVAYFNFDSEAKTFQGHVLAEGLDGRLVTIDRDMREFLLRFRTEIP